MNKWFKKQHRTDTDARLDKKNPNRYKPPPMDADVDNEGRPITVAPATHRDRLSVGLGGNRPLKGGLFERYRQEAAEAVAGDKEKSERVRLEGERIRLEKEEERVMLQSRQTPQSYPRTYSGEITRGGGGRASETYAPYGRGSGHSPFQYSR